MKSEEKIFVPPRLRDTMTPILKPSPRLLLGAQDIALPNHVVQYRGEIPNDLWEYSILRSEAQLMPGT